MKTTPIIAALLALAPMTFAQEAPAVESAAQGEEVILELIADLEKMATIFERITDKESADKAAAEIRPIRDKMIAKPPRLEHLDPKIVDKHMPKIEELMQKMNPLMEKVIEADFYGSEALKAIDDNPNTQQITHEIEQLVEEYMALVMQLAQMVEGLTDKESADKAAAEIALLRPRVEAIALAFENFDTEVVMKLLHKHEEEIDKIEMIFDKLKEKDFYGSDSLKKVMDHRPQGEIDDEEEEV